MTTRQPDDPRNQIPPDVLAAAVELELREIKERANTRSQERKEKRQASRTPQPTHNRYRAISSGTYKRMSRPVAKVEDRQYVPGALAHWRRVHGLSQADALVRIGYSPNSSTWRQWEDGVNAPPYRALLTIIAFTGLGYWTEHGMPTDGLLGDSRLAALNTNHRMQRAHRRRGRRRANRQR